MSLSPLPLSYCTNVHPGQTVAEILDGLSRYTVPLQRQSGQPIAAGLWLAEPVIRELKATPHGSAKLALFLRERSLICYTLNAFPFGNFHSPRVKENVYLPDWSESTRLDYTLDCANVLAELLPDDIQTGSISTVPLGFRGFQHPPDFLDRCCDRLIHCATEFQRMEEQTGKTIRLAIEPEPCCVLETTPQTLEFFERLRDRAHQQNAGDAVTKFIGVCYDVCHQSVEFEDVAVSIDQLTQAGIRINKVHITCAVELLDPANHPAGREALARFAEPRYLHQTFAKRTQPSEVLHELDLTAELATNPPERFASAEMWRIHFHVPVNAESLGPLGTTRADLKTALATVKTLPYAPHLEVETYTWNVLPGMESVSLVDGLTQEIRATHQLLTDLRGL